MKPRVQCYRDLLVWQRGMDLAVETYRLVKLLPKSEFYGFRAQMQRAAVSIPANIAEGHGRSSTGAYVNHLGIANGSLMEFETYLYLCLRLGYIPPEDVVKGFELCQDIGRMLRGLVGSLRMRKHGRGGGVLIPDS